MVQSKVHDFDDAGDRVALAEIIQLRVEDVHNLAVRLFLCFSVDVLVDVRDLEREFVVNLFL